jgi:hypothetical protein
LKLEEFEIAAKEAKTLTQVKPTFSFGFLLLGQSHVALYHHREALQAFMDGFHSCVMTGQTFSEELIASLTKLVVSFTKMSDEEQQASATVRQVPRSGRPCYEISLLIYSN